MHFLLSSMSVGTPISEDGGDDATVEQINKRAKWDNNDYICRGLILNVMEQYNELIGILRRFQAHLETFEEELTLVELGSHLRIEKSLRMQDSDKLKGNNVVGPLVVNMVEHNNSSRKPGHLKKDCKGGKLGNKANGLGTNGLVDGSTNSLKGQNMFNKYFQVYYVTYVSKAYFVQDDDVAWWVDSGATVHVCKDRCWTESRVLGAVVRLPNPKLKTLGERGIECIFVGYAEHSKDFRFYVIEPNDSVSINSIIESRDAIFDENRFSSVPRPSQKSLVKGTEDSGGLVVPEKVTEEVVQQPEPELRKSKRNRTPKDFRPEFQLYLIEGTRDEVSDQHSYCFNVEDDPKTFDKAMKSQDVANLLVANGSSKENKVDGTVEKFKARLVIQGFKQKSGIYYFDTYALVARIYVQYDMRNDMASICKSVIHLDGCEDDFIECKFNETGKEVIICLYVDDMLIFGAEQVQVNLKKEFLSSTFSMKDMGEADVILVSTPMDTSEKLRHNNGQAVSQLEYSRVIGCLMYAMTCTRPDIAFAVGKLSRLTYTGYPSVLEGYTDASWISNTEDNSSTSGWVFLLHATAGKEAEWLKNLLLKIPLWSKPIAPISIRCDSAATLAKAYS
ncbi:zinc finger, CCHC-type containing protein [Tanacetum coccineum]